MTNLSNEISADSFGSDTNNYIRVGSDYFKKIRKKDRFGIVRVELKRWKKDEIKLDHRDDSNFLFNIQKYDDFVIEPNNTGLNPVIDNCYNMYNLFPHSHSPGSWKWTDILLQHIFGSQYDAGLMYLKVLYMFPKQALPILALVSEERATGKSTFLDWLNMIFGANMSMIEPDVIGSTFNAEYATSNIIAIDETIIDKQIAVEKIKSLATKKFISVNMKNVSQFKLPFFGKIIMASNNEDKFMRIDDKEIRFWIRRISKPSIENHNILNDMVVEIPAFLHHLTTLPEIDFSKSRMVLTEDQIKNEFLAIIKKESMSNLYKEIIEVATNLFDQIDDDEHQIMFIPQDLKNRFWKYNNNISINYIRRVLKQEFKIDTLKNQRYTVLDTDAEWVGRPFYFKKKFFNGQSFLHESYLNDNAKRIDTKIDGEMF